MMRAAALAVVLIATPASAADQFDLLCSYDGGTVRYRVDLTKGEACSDACDRVWKMGPATTGELKLIDRVPAYRGDLEERATVNRITGEYRSLVDVNGKRYHREGKCAPMPFTGFPTPRF